MSNGDDQQQYNCALGICCGGTDNEKQIRAIGEILQHRLGTQNPSMHAIAKAVFDSFDLADKGTLKPLFDSVAKFARGNAYEG